MALSGTWGSLVAADSAITSIGDTPQYFEFGGSEWISLDPLTQAARIRGDVTFSGGDRDLEILIFGTLDDGASPDSDLNAANLYRLSRALGVARGGPLVANLYRFRVGVRRAPGGSVVIGSCSLDYRIGTIA